VQQSKPTSEGSPSSPTERVRFLREDIAQPSQPSPRIRSRRSDMPLSAALDTVERSNGFGRVQSVLVSCSDLIVSCCLMMARLLGEDKKKLLVWLWLRSVKQCRRSLSRSRVMCYWAGIILFSTRRYLSAILTVVPAMSTMIFQLCRAKVVNTRSPIGQRYG